MKNDLTYHVAVVRQLLERAHDVETREEIIKRQIGIFREVPEDLASRLEKATGIKRLHCRKLDSLNSPADVGLRQ